MIGIKLFIFLNIIYLIFGQNLFRNQEDYDPIIEPLELLLRSTDNEGVFDCNSRVQLNKQQSKLTASIENLNMTPPMFLLKTEQTNGTTIRIRVKPNGYIGLNRISCHWKNNQTFGHTADLIIGENPGVIQLKEPCLAFDRRYVQCIFRATTIARAFQNGFPKIFMFSELNQDSLAYRPAPVLVNIINSSDLVFHFEPRERNVIPKKILMSVNMTLRRFGSSVYRFNLEPIHTTKVNFQIQDIHNKQFTIHITHNNSGTVHPRLCSGHISQIDDDKTWKAVQDITPTTDQKIFIKDLRSSVEYEVCLRCYYELTDPSVKEKKCERTKTHPAKISWGIILIIIPGLTVLIAVGLALYFKKEWVKKFCGGHKHEPKTEFKLIKSNSEQKTEVPDDPRISVVHYSDEPSRENDPFLPSAPESSNNDPNSCDDDKYLHLGDSIRELTDSDKVAPDTYDLTRQKTTQ